MDGLHKWMQKQINEKKVEPNSGLGEAITYMEKRWDQLTLFLREPNAPLDNNAVYTARGVNGVTPPAGLCRVVFGGAWSRGNLVVPDAA
jgi:hypothetical protein